jgi:hypothetical protein
VVHVDAAYLSAVSALAGSIVGGLISGVTTWLSERTRTRAGKLAHDLARREDLFKDFIIAASKAYGEALMRNEPPTEGFCRGCARRTVLAVRRRSEFRQPCFVSADELIE